VPVSIEHHNKKHAHILDGLIVMCCVKDLLEIKKELCVPIIRKYNAPTLIFLLSNYENCKILGKSSREFTDQTHINVNSITNILGIFGKNNI